MKRRLSRELVHKHQHENVFVEQIRQVAPDEFVSTSSYPVGHVAYNDSNSGLSAACYFVEVGRQINLAITHTFYDVPLDAGFLIASIDWQFAEETPFIPETIESFEIRTKVVEVSERRGQLAKIGARCVYVDPAGDEFLSGGGSFLVSSKKMNDVKRSAPPLEMPRPASPRRVQVSKPINVLIGEERDDQGRSPMVVNTNHPYFFEHRNDHHVPGMMLLEAAKQAAVYNAPDRFEVLEDLYGDSISGKIRFGRFASLAETVWIRCDYGELEERGGNYVVPVDIYFEQAGRQLGEIRCIFAFRDHYEIEIRSGIWRQRLDHMLSGAASGIPMNGAFQ